MGGQSGNPGVQLYTSGGPPASFESAPTGTGGMNNFTQGMQIAGGTSAGQMGGAGGTNTQAGTHALFFGAPGPGMGMYGTPPQGGKGQTGGWNQMPSGMYAPHQDTNYDPSLAMNAVYAPQNLAAGTYTTQAPDIAPPEPAPTVLPGAGSPFSGFSFNNPYMLGPYSYLGQRQSPFGVSPLWANGGYGAGKSW